MGFVLMLCDGARRAAAGEEGGAVYRTTSKRGGTAICGQTRDSQHDSARAAEPTAAIAVRQRGLLL